MTRPGPNKQRGGTLFVALSILILLTLLALAAARVTGLQERMAGGYRADVVAFELAEAALRDDEHDVLDPSGLACDIAVEDTEFVDTMTVTETDEDGNETEVEIDYDWRDGDFELPDGSTISKLSKYENLNNTQSRYARGINLRGSSVRAEMTPGGINCMVFRVSTLSTDNPVAPQATTVLQSTFTP
jgi:Tfp pilus assembly protein PilX